MYGDLIKNIFVSKKSQTKVFLFFIVELVFSQTNKIVIKYKRIKEMISSKYKDNKS